MHNIFVERLWKTVRNKEVYLHDYQTGSDVRKGMIRYFLFYNRENVMNLWGIKPPIGSMKEIHPL